MKKIFVFIMVLLLCALGNISVSALGFTLSHEKYLIDEDFLMTDGTPGGTGWDVHEAGGEIHSGWGRFFLRDDSPYLPVDMKHDFKAQSLGKVTTEFRFYFTKDIEGFSWQLRCGEEPAVWLKTRQGAIYAVKPDQTEQKLINYSAFRSLDEEYTPFSEAEYGIRIETDLDNGIYDVYINGYLYGDDIPIGENIIDNIMFSSPEASTGKIYIYPVRVYKDHYLNETFISTKTDKENRTSYMNISAFGGSAACESMNCQLWPDRYDLRIKTGISGIVTYQKNIDVTDELIAFEYSVIDTDGIGGLSAELGDSIRIKMDQGSFSFNDEPFYNGYIQNLWYTVKVIADYEQGLCDLYINNIKQAENISLLGEGRNKVSFKTIRGKKVNIGLDDIFVYPVLPEPGDYVSMPSPSYSSLDVGMISCSLWRCGKQFGWDRIAPFPGRKPYLGFYDEGNPEVADWETKMMTEHGVDFEIFCWMKPDGSYGSPIKTPNWAYQIEAYKNSKYSDMMKYCLLFENNTAPFNGIDDFKDNIVPYFIEHYFKDPRYYRIDGKPVFTVYHMNKFAIQMSGGGEADFAKAKEAIDFFRSECVNAGLGGLVVMTCSLGGSNFVEFDELKNIGVDAVYPYGWDMSGANPAYTKRMSQWVINNGLDLIGSAVTGMDAEPWNGVKGHMATASEFSEMCRWLAREYVPQTATGRYGKNIVVIDNWNEIGEGHYVQPSAENGWDYLDAIKNYFCGTSAPCAHTLPTSAQASRIQVLYDQNRTGYKTEPKSPPASRYPSMVIKGWYFNSNAEGWDLSNGFSDTKVQNGALYLKSGSDFYPSMNISGLNIDTNNTTYIKVRMKKSADTACRCEFSFTTDLFPNEVYSQNYIFASEDGDWNDYYIDLSSNACWQGMLSILKFNPFAGSGEAWIDSIEILGALEDVNDAVVIDGKIYLYEPVSMNGSIALPAADVIKKYGNAVFDFDTDGREELLFKFRNDAYIIRNGERKYSVNGKEAGLTNLFFMNNGKLYAPVEFFEDIFILSDISYDNTKNTVYISKKTVRKYNFNGMTDNSEGKPRYDGYKEPFIGGGWGINQSLGSNIGQWGGNGFKITFDAVWDWAKITLPESAGSMTYHVRIPMKRTSDTGRFVFMSAAKMAKNNDETASFSGGQTMNFAVKNAWYYYDKTFTLLPGEERSIYMLINGVGYGSDTNIEICMDNIEIEMLDPIILPFKNSKPAKDLLLSENDKNAEISVMAANMKAENKEYTLYICLYKDGRLVSVDKTNTNINNNTFCESERIGVLLPDDISDIEVRAFL